MTLLIGWSHAADEPDDLAELGPGFGATVALQRGEWVGAAPRGDRDATRSQRKAFRLWSRGKPDPDRQGRLAGAISGAYDVVQVLSEPNLCHLGRPADVEEWPPVRAEDGSIDLAETAADCARWLGDTIDAAGENHRIGLTPFSPAPGAHLEAWLTTHAAVATRCVALLAHAYGDEREMWDAVQPVVSLARRLGKPVWVTECGPKKGQSVDAFAAALPGFLDRVSLEAPEVEVVAIFAPAWPRPDPGWDALRLAGTAVYRAMMTWKAPQATQEPNPDGGDVGDTGAAVVPGIDETHSPASTGATMQLGLLYRMGTDIPETTVDQIADLCQRGGFAIVSPKVKEAEAWMGGPERWQDKDPVLAITGAESLLAQRDAYARRGIALHPWAVYRGMDWEAEARAHAEVANLLKMLVVDFEWGYAGFADHGTWPDVVNYCALLRQLTPGATLVFCPDPRQVQRGEYRIADVARSFDAYSPQAYWTDFQQDAPDVLDAAIKATPPGLACWPMLPGNSDPVDLDAAIGQALHAECGPVFYVFQRVGLREGNLPVLKAWAEREAPPIESTGLAAPQAVLSALDVLWNYVGADVEKQRRIIDLKVALGLQEAS